MNSDITATPLEQAIHSIANLHVIQTLLIVLALYVIVSVAMYELQAAKQERESRKSITKRR